MRTLLVTVNLPYPPASGGAIRMLGILHGMYEANHEITLLSFYNGDIQLQSTPLSTYCEKIVTLPLPPRTKIDRLRTLFLSIQPDIAHRFYDDKFARTLSELLQQTQFDLIQFEAIEAVCYLPIAKKLQPDAIISFDTFNAEYALQRNMFEIDIANIRRWPLAAYSYIQMRRITRFEREMCRIADIVFAVSSEDAELLADFREDRKVYIVPSGIFVKDYEQSDVLEVDLKQPAMVFTGTMNYRPNVDAILWFAESALPDVIEQRPSAQLYVVGNRPHPRLESLRSHTNIHITGWVDSTQPYLNAATLYVAPLRMGSGTRLKLLEAMACGCAIVATSTAAAGLLDDIKRAMIIVDTAQEMAEAIVSLLDDVQRRQALGVQARELVRKHYDWSMLTPNLLAAYKENGLG